ncbi:hypothetical protein CGW93_00005 [candidate division bacterium WOR-3 4484_18]|uniref:MIP18 family-like domain-containing protein n=1 Tax=candidate division WOR-3 bacterium 4484_18 TaxID=2020626 RepID=A0A257LV73_UNCW3|nr:DUF59 domain-containing protein [candidate division WOR-3 bacterium]OYV03588.1 MAG: hypothetical protein CGW93_00005 [candidate division bacterium WOR-3 4484_18]
MKEKEKEKVVEVLKQVMDPEIGINVWDLGLIYGVEVDEANRVNIKMTLTVPGCPLAAYIVQTVKLKLQEAGFHDVDVELVWEPRWTPERMSDKAKEMLGWK